MKYEKAILYASFLLIHQYIMANRLISTSSSPKDVHIIKKMLSTPFLMLSRKYKNSINTSSIFVQIYY